MSDKSTNTNSSKRKTTVGSRADGLIRFYATLERLESGVGGKCRLSCCDSKMGWPECNVCFFFEHGESRSCSGDGPHIAFVGAHAVTRGSKRTLWNGISQHRGSAKTGGDSHRSSLFRLLVGEALTECDPEYAVGTWNNQKAWGSHVCKAAFELERLLS